MSLEQLKVITQAENEASLIRSDATAQAKKIVFEARKNGEKLIESTIVKSNQEVVEVLQAAEKAAKSNANDINARALQDSQDLKTKILDKKDSSVSFILEKIVKS